MNDSKDHKAAAEAPLDCRVGRDIVDRLRDTDRRLVAAGHETYIGDAANEIENLRAMYDAQCRCTDEWAEKYQAEVERKGDEALLRRVKELEDALAAVNSRLAAAQAAPNGEVRGASRIAGEASSAEGATSTVVLGTQED